MTRLSMAAIATSETSKIRMETFGMQRESKDCFESVSNFFQALAIVNFWNSGVKNRDFGGANNVLRLF